MRKQSSINQRLKSKIMQSSIFKAINTVRNQGEYKFGVRTISKGRTSISVPVVKEPGLLSTWRPIVKIYDNFIVMDYEAPQGLSREDCIGHIQGFRAQLKEQEIENFTNDEVEEIV